jgi:hypothetical protein
MSQNELLLTHLKKFGSISGVEAAAVYKIRALPRRIKDLRERGVLISDVWKHDALGQRYKRYSLTKMKPALAKAA